MAHKKSGAKKCSRSKFKVEFRKLIKNHTFKTAVRMAWSRACTVR